MHQGIVNKMTINTLNKNLYDLARGQTCQNRKSLYHHKVWHFRVEISVFFYVVLYYLNDDNCPWSSQCHINLINVIRDKLLTVHYCSKEVNIKFQLLESRINTPSRSYNQVKANKPWIWCPLDCFLQDGWRSFPGKGVVQRQNKVTESSIRTTIDTNCAEFVWRIALFSFLFLVEHVASWIQKGTSLFSRKAIPSFVI